MDCYIPPLGLSCTKAPTNFLSPGWVLYSTLTQPVLGPSKLCPKWSVGGQAVSAIALFFLVSPVWGALSLHKSKCPSVVYLLALSCVTSSAASSSSSSPSFLLVIHSFVNRFLYLLSMLIERLLSLVLLEAHSFEAHAIWQHHVPLPLLPSPNLLVTFLCSLTTNLAILQPACQCPLSLPCSSLYHHTKAMLSMVSVPVGESFNALYVDPFYPSNFCVNFSHWPCSVTLWSPDL